MMPYNAFIIQFRFAGSTEKLMMLAGLVAACLNGAALPLMIVVFGEMTDLFISDGAFENWLDFYWDNITAVFPNATKDIIMDNPDVIMWVMLAYRITYEWNNCEQL